MGDANHVDATGAAAPRDRMDADMPWAVREVDRVPVRRGLDMSPFELLLRACATSATGVVCAEVGDDNRAKSVSAQCNQWAGRHAKGMFKAYKRGTAVYVEDLTRKVKKEGRR